jgi:hypothetical protein
MSGLFVTSDFGQFPWVKLGFFAKAFIPCAGNILYCCGVVFWNSFHKQTFPQNTPDVIRVPQGVISCLFSTLLSPIHRG